VAIKLLKDRTQKGRLKFLQEAAIVAQFNHPNVVRMLGFVPLGDPIMIMLELARNGSLHAWLQRVSALEVMRK
jgi:serine/threonine protein kinase